MTNPRHRILALIREELDNPLRQWTEPSDDTTLADLGADPLDLIVIAMAMEDEFGMALHDHDVIAETTVGELCALVAREVGERV